MRLAFFKVLVPALTLVSALGCTPVDRPARVVLIVVDTLRADALALAETPSLDALAARGQSFPNALASFHQTPMSMSAIFTGRTPSIEMSPPPGPQELTLYQWCGVLRLTPPGQTGPCISADVPTLADALRAAGYETLGVTSNGLLFEPFGLASGFDDWTEVGERAVRPGDDRKKGEAARTRSLEHVHAAALETLARRRTDAFFLYVHYMDVHDFGQQNGRPGYLAALERVDAAIGRLLDALAADGLLEDALVVVTSDHGHRLGEQHFVAGTGGHGGNPSFEELLRVPLIAAPALDADPARVVRGEDLAGLIARAAGAAFEPAKELAHGELFVSETFWQTYRDGRWKSFRRRDDPSGAVALIDLEADPAETTDVAAEQPEIAARHRARIDEITRTLAAPRALFRRQPPRYDEQLRALGYVE
jgi:arylsulfatase A-like enzyme